MIGEKYIGLDVHQATISVAVMDSKGKVVMQSILETQAATILEFFARMENGVVDWTHTFNSNLLSETRVGVNSVRVEAGGADNGGLGNVGEKLGIANGNDHGPGLLEIRLGGGEVSSFGSSNIGTQE